MMGMTKKLTVNMISESETSVQGHGVHTAYVEIVTALQKRKDIITSRSDLKSKEKFDILHFHTIGPAMWSRMYGRASKKVISVHIVPDSLVGSIVLAKYWKPLAGFYMKKIYGHADKLLAVSGSVAKILEKDLKISPDKIEVFYNTIDMSQYKTTSADKKSARKKLGLGYKEFIVLGNGQVQPRKRLDVFLKMAEEMPNVKFIWVGGIPFKHIGADYAKMNRLMKSTPSNMTITGVIPHAQVRDYLQAADVFCLPAEQENHPMCVLEAAGADLPIVLRDILEYDDTFRGDAILCKDDEFGPEIKKLMADNKYYETQKLKTKNIAHRFDSSVAADRLVKIYKELV